MTVNSIKEVYQYYLTKAQETVSHLQEPQILKTDCYNEYAGMPFSGGIVKNVKTDGTFTLVELQLEAIDKAKSLYPDLDIVQGDVRSLPFPNSKFDLVLDLSTLDHIPPEDIPQVISEYARVLKPEGILQLVSWYCQEGHESPPQPYSPENWYHYSEKAVKPTLESLFDVQFEERFFELGHDYLKLSVGRKR